MRALVSLDTDQIWALLDLLPEEDAVAVARFAVCERQGMLVAVPGDAVLGPCDRWACLADLPEALRQ